MTQFVSRMLRWVVTCILLVAGAAPVGAQCMPDNLTGPCCAPTQVRLPPFPPFRQGVKYLCWDECAPRVNRDVCIDLGAPTPVVMGGGQVCGVFTIRYTVRLCGGAGTVLWTGTLAAHYSRNWLEFNAMGTQAGVWRFIVNGDLVPSSFVVQRFGTNPCAVPPCYFQFGRFYVQGYIDYAQDCQTQQWQVAGVIDHGCDAVTHNGFSARPAPAAGFHPGQSYSWVHPAAGFVPFTPTTANPRSDGPIIQENVRFNDWTTRPNICRFEEPISQGVFQALGEFCYCTVAGSPNPQYVDTQVSGFASCGTQFQSGGPLRFLQKRIGNWTMPGVYPNTEYVLLDFGNLTYRNGCTQLGTTEYFEGVETLFGNPAQSYSNVTLGRQFEDLASSNAVTAPMPVMVIGIPHISWYILNLNLL